MSTPKAGSSELLLTCVFLVTTMSSKVFVSRLRIWLGSILFSATRSPNRGSIFDKLRKARP